MVSRTRRWGRPVEDVTPPGLRCHTETIKLVKERGSDVMLSELCVAAVRVAKADARLSRDTESPTGEQCTPLAEDLPPNCEDQHRLRQGTGELFKSFIPKIFSIRTQPLHNYLRWSGIALNWFYGQGQKCWHVILGYFEFRLEHDWNTLKHESSFLSKWVVRTQIVKK